MADAATADLARSTDAALVQAVEQRLLDWVSTQLGPCTVRREAPAPGAANEASVGLYLMALARAPAMRTTPVTSPLEFALRYLVTVWGDAAHAGEQLCQLAFAAMETPDFDVDFEPLPWDAWRAFGIAPRPAFVLQLPLRKARVHRTAPRVRELQLNPVPMQPLVGRVVGPGDTALMDAKVTLLTLDRVARSDSAGMFRFDGVPTGKPLRVRVHARGVVQDLTLTALPPADETWVVNMPL